MAKFGRAGSGPVPSKEPGALERLKELEGKVKELEGFRAEILRAVRQTFAAVEKRLQNLEEVNAAVVNVVGRGAIEDEVKRAHIENSEKKAAVEMAALEAAYKVGKIVDADAVGDLSVIVGSEKDKDGGQLYPTTVQLLFPTLMDEYQAALRGHVAGDVIETPFGSKFTISRVYDVNPKFQEAQQADAFVPPAGTPPIEAEPLSPEAEEALVEELAAAAEQIESEKDAVEEQLIDDLAKN